MVHPENREIMGALYRIMERYEEPPQCQYVEDALAYFEPLVDDVIALVRKYNGNEYAKQLGIGLLEATERIFQARNTMPMKHKGE